MTDYTAFLRFGSDSRDVRTSDKDLESLERQSYKTEKAASALGRTLGRAFAAISVGAVARQIIKNTIEQEKVTAQLNQTLRSTGRYSEETSQALLSHAAALQQVTTYGDEAIVSAQSQLLTFDRLGSEVFPRATEAALDLSAKMGGDLASAIVKVGKALNDPVKGLTELERAGLHFTETQKDQIKELVKANDLLGAQRIVLEKLEAQYGGSARAARNTFGGALKAVQNALGDLLEADGDSLPGATRAVNDLADALNDPDVKAGIDTITTGVINMVAALAQMPGTVKFVADELKAGFGAVADTDIPRVEERLAILQRRLDAMGGDERGFFNRVFGDGMTRAEIIAEVEHLTRLVDAFYNTPRDVKPAGGAIPGLDNPLAPVEVTGERRDKDLAKITEANERALARLRAEIQKTGEAAARDLDSMLRDLAGTMGGPAVQAAIALSDTYAMLAEQEAALAAAGQLTVEREQQLASARALATQAYQERIEAIRAEEEALAARLTPAEQLIQDLEFEGELMVMTHKEREIAIALRYAEVDAMSVEGQAITDLIEKRQKERDGIRAMDELRGASADLLYDLADGSKSAGDAIDDYFERLKRRALQVASEKLIEKLFGSFGSGQGGIAGGQQGGAFADIIGAIFGGGRAMGGSVMPGRLYEVGEQGPELLNLGRRQFLIPGQSGSVVPNHQITNNNSNASTIVVNMPPEARRRSTAALAAELFRESQRHSARNR